MTTQFTKQTSTTRSRLTPGRWRSKYALLAAGLAVCACADDPSTFDDAADETAAGTGARSGLAVATEHEKPLHHYTIALGEGHAVSYRAYADGAIVVGEQGRVGVDDVVTKGVNGSPRGPVALFKAVHPGSVVPSELVKLQAFMDHVEAATRLEDESVSVGSGSASLPEATAARSIPKDITGDRATFLNAFGCFFGSGDVFDACVPNFTGPAFATASSRWAIYKIAPISGELRFDTTIAGKPRFSLPLSPGGFWVQTQNGPLHTHKYEYYPDIVVHRLDTFTSGEHHFSARFHNYLTSDPNCAESWSADQSENFRSTATTTIVPVCTSHYGRLSW